MVVCGIALHYHTYAYSPYWLKGKNGKITNNTQREWRPNILAYANPLFGTSCTHSANFHITVIMKTHQCMSPNAVFAVSSTHVGLHSYSVLPFYCVRLYFKSILVNFILYDRMPVCVVADVATLTWGLSKRYGLCTCDFVPLLSGNMANCLTISKHHDSPF